ncbi:MAG: VOC family protein [Tepidisphaeraceae bacterium]
MKSGEIARMPPVLQRVDRINLRVDNVAAASRFYAETLGLKLDRQQHGAAALRFQQGETELVLHSDKQKPDVEIVLGVADVQAIYDRRQELGLTFLNPPTPSGRGHRATLRDPFGNVIAIADRGEHPASATKVATVAGACSKTRRPPTRPRIAPHSSTST